MKELAVFPFVRPAELDKPQDQPHPVVVIGGGLSGLSLALDLARRGIKVTVLDDDNTVGVRGLASRGMVWAQRTLDIFDRWGVAEKITGKGVRWNVGRVLCQDQPVTSFVLQEQPDMHHNGFANLQQYYLEEFLVHALQEEPLAEIRWLNKVTGIEQIAGQDGEPEKVRLQVNTPEGDYSTEALWVVACDGASSPTRSMLGLAPEVFDRTDDRWIIIDVILRNASWPEERWTWLNASGNQGRAVWRHKMADDTWRLDFQLHPDEDAQQALTESAMRERVNKLVGETLDFDIAWHGVWAYRHECLPSLRHQRVLFSGDAAHLVAPFGARGGNGGVQDGDNLGWKLALVLQGQARAELLDTYDHERKHAAMENIRQARRSSRFVYPAAGSSASMWRDTIIALAREHDVPARMVNTGRLCMPAIYPPSTLVHAGHALAGCALPNVVIRKASATQSAQNLHGVLGPWFTALVFAESLPAWAQQANAENISQNSQSSPRTQPLLRWVAVGEHCDAAGREALQRQLKASIQPVAADAQIWLIRPDQHVMQVAGGDTSTPVTEPQITQWLAQALQPEVGKAATLPQQHSAPACLGNGQQQLDDTLEYLVALTEQCSLQEQRDRLAQLSLLLIERLSDAASANEAVRQIVGSRQSQPLALAIP